MAKRPVIFQGSDKILNLKLREENGDPFDLTGETEITVCFKAADGGASIDLTKGGGDVTITGSLLLGKISVSISDANTDLIETGEKVDFMVYVDKGAIRTPIAFFQLIDVKEPPC